MRLTKLNLGWSLIVGSIAMSVLLILSHVASAQTGGSQLYDDTVVSVANSWDTGSVCIQSQYPCGSSRLVDDNGTCYCYKCDNSPAGTPTIDVCKYNGSGAGCGTTGVSSATCTNCSRKDCGQKAAGVCPVCSCATGGTPVGTVTIDIAKC